MQLNEYVGVPQRQSASPIWAAAQSYLLALSWSESQLYASLPLVFLFG